MAKMQIQAPDGTLVDAEEIEYNVEHEPWTVLKLEDGSTIRVRVAVVKVIRLDQWDPLTGDPMYLVQSAQNQMRVQVPVKLKKFQQKDDKKALKGMEVG